MSINLDPQNNVFIHQCPITYDETKALSIIEDKNFYWKKELSEYLKTSGSTNAMRYQLALIVLQKDPYKVFNEIQQFNIEEETQRYHLASLIAKDHPDLIVKGVERFNLTEEQHRFDLAILLAEHMSWSLAHYICKFQIKRQFLFAIKFAEKHPEDVSYLITEFELTLKERHALAMFMVEKAPKSLCSGLDKYNLTREQRLALAEIMVEKAPSSLCSHIDYFAREGEEILFAENLQKRIRLAETVVKESPYALCVGIKKLHIQENKIRFKLANSVVEKKDDCFCCLVQNFNLSVEQLDFLGTKLIETNSDMLLQHFEKFTKNGHTLFANDEAKRFALAKKVAKSNQELLAEKITILNITDNKNSFELAKIVFHGGNKYRLPYRYQYIKDFKLTQTQRFNLAETAAENNANEFCNKIDCFFIRKQKDFVALADIVMKKDPGLLCNHFEKFSTKNGEGLFAKNEEKRINLAKLAAKQSPSTLCGNIKKLNITSNEILFSLAKQAIHSWELYYYIKNFNLTEEQIFEIAMEGATKDASRLSRSIKELNITNPNHAFALAKRIIDTLDSSWHWDDFIDNFKYFNVSSEQKLQLIEMIIQMDKSKFYFHVEKFHLTPEECFSFVMAQTDFEYYHLNYFRFRDQQSMITLAEKILKIDPHTLGSYFGQFKDVDGKTLCENDEEKRLAFAYSIAEKDRLFSDNVKKFNIKDSEKRFALAKFHIENKGAFIRGISEFELNEEQNFSLLQLEAKQNPHEICYHFENIHLTDEEKIFTLVKIILEKEMYWFFEYFNKFKITKKEHLFSIGNIVLEKKSYLLIEHISKLTAPDGEQFLANDIDKRIALAKHVANEHAHTLCKYVKNLNITDENVLISLIKTVGEEIPMPLGMYYHNFGFNRQFVASLLSEKSAATFILGTLFHEQMFDEWPFKIEKKFFFHIISAHQGTCSLMSQSSINDDSIFSDPKFHFMDMQSIHFAIEKNHSMYLEKANSILANFLVLCKIHPNLDLIKQSILNNPKLLADIFSIRDINLLAPPLISLLEITCQKPIPEGGSAFTLVWTTTEVSKHPIRPKDLKDNLFTNPLLHMVITVKSELHLTADVKTKVFKWVFENPTDKGQILARSNVIRSICNFKGAEHLSKEDYEVTLRELALKLLPALKDCSNEQLQKTFLSSRKPFALFTYAGCLATIKNEKKEEVLTLVGEFAREVALGNFPQSRRDNVHLQAIREKFPSILEAYHQGGTKIISATLKGELQNPHIKIREILRNALNDDHIRDQDLIVCPHIPEVDKNFTELRKIAQPNLEKSIKELEARIERNENKELVNYLNLQLYLMRLTQKGTTLEKYNHAMNFVVKFFKADSLFLTIDMPSLSRLLIKPKDREVTLHLNDTDNPYDILLCGTEVEGSCQRIDGKPDLNRGLLGYLLNGQTRLITMKERANGSIKGRAILRLLLDKEDKAVLFLERIYPQTLPDELKKILINFAMERGKELNLPVLCSNHGGEYGSTIRSLGGRASEYVDGAYGVKEKAVYTITDPFVLS